MSANERRRYQYFLITNDLVKHMCKVVPDFRKGIQYIPRNIHTVFVFAVLCCGFTLTDFPISIRLTSLALWQSNDCPSASKATLMNMDKYFKWIHYERLHNHNKAKHNKTVCIFLGIYCISRHPQPPQDSFSIYLLYSIDVVSTLSYMNEQWGKILHIWR